jgi:regulator of CtrA degradation
MTDKTTKMTLGGNEEVDAVDFAERMASSENFLALFREGMNLLEETADYLDGPGRTQSRELSRLGGLAYATESMKLTTRLMQMASWLLLQRAVNDGEISRDQARHEKAKVRLEHPEDQERSAGFEELPEWLRELIARSLRLQARIRHLDRQLDGAVREKEPVNPVQDQLSRVRSVFGSGEG